MLEKGFQSPDLERDMAFFFMKEEVKLIIKIYLNLSYIRDKMKLCSMTSNNIVNMSMTLEINVHFSGDCDGHCIGQCNCERDS